MKHSASYPNVLNAQNSYPAQPRPTPEATAHPAAANRAYQEGPQPAPNQTARPRRSPNMRGYPPRPPSYALPVPVATHPSTPIQLQTPMQRQMPLEMPLSPLLSHYQAVAAAAFQANAARSSASPSTSPPRPPPPLSRVPLSGPIPAHPSTAHSSTTRSTAIRSSPAQNVSSVGMSRSSLPGSWRELHEKLNQVPIGVTLQVLASFVTHSREPAAPGTLEVVASRLPALLEATESSDPAAINSTNLSALSNGFRHYECHADVTDKVISTLIHGVTKWLKYPQMQGEPHAVSNLLYNCRFLREVDNTPRLMAEVAAHIDRIDAQGATFTPCHVGNTFYGMQRMTDSDQVRDVLGGLLPHVKYAGPLSGRDIGGVLLGMQTLGNSIEAERIREALIPHIQQVGSINLGNIYNVLSGLQHVQPSPACNQIITALRQKLPTIDQRKFIAGFADDRAISLYLLEAIHSLRHHLVADDAIELVHALHDLMAVREKPGRDVLANPLTRQTWLVRAMLDDAMRPDDRNFSSNGVDLHGFSHSLAEETCRHAIAQFENQSVCDDLLIVYGRASHKPENNQKMRRAVEQAMQSFQGIADWKEDGRVRLYKDSATSSPA